MSEFIIDVFASCYWNYDRSGLYTRSDRGKEPEMIRCEFCKKCVQLMSAGRVYCERAAGRKVLRMQESDCGEFEPFMYYDTDSCQPEPLKPISCTIFWSSGETTYLKGKNALRIARSWLYSDSDCLLVYTPGWIYLKSSREEIST